MRSDETGVLLVSSSEKGVEAVKTLLADTDFAGVSVARSAGEARRLTLSRSFDVVIINAPLTDEFGSELAIYMTQNTASGVMLVVRSELAADYRLRMRYYGIAVQPKPFDRPSFIHNMYMLAAIPARFGVLREENTRLKRALEEIRLVGRAKNVLIKSLSMTEPQAHRYIEKQAMDMRIPRSEVALAIIKTYTDSY